MSHVDATVALAGRPKFRVLVLGVVMRGGLLSLAEHRS